MLRLWTEGGASTVASEWLSKFEWMLRYAAPQAAILVVLLLFLAAVAVGRGSAAGAALRRASIVVAAGLFVSAAVLVFYTCLGWVFPRLAYPLIPPLIVAAGALAL